MRLFGAVMEIWRLKDMYTDTQTHGTTDRHTDTHGQKRPISESPPVFTTFTLGGNN